MATSLYGLLLSSNADVARASLTSDARLLTCGELTAVVRTEAGAAARPSLEDVQQHDAVLQAIVDAGVTVAAAKFGQRFADDAECATEIRARAPRVAPQLVQWDGCVEMRLLRRMPAAMPASPPDAASPGRAYLEGLRASRDRLRAFGVRSLFGAIVRAEDVSELPNDVIAVAHAVRRADLSKWKEIVAAAPELAHARALGPTALYSFVDQ